MIYSSPILNFNSIKFYFSSNRNKIRIEEYPSKFWSNSGSESLGIIFNSVVGSKNIYLPKYFCGQSLSYLRGVNANIIFYDIDDNFNIDFEKTLFWSELSKSDIVVIVHYFGQISNYEKLLQLKTKINFTIIEDCAHINIAHNSGKWIGEFLIFSPHKHYPIQSIGLILSKRKITANYAKWNKTNFIWFFKQLIKKIAPAKSLTIWKVKWSSNIHIISKRGPNNTLTKIAENFMSRSENNNEVLISNSREARDILNKYPGWTVLNCDSEHPYGIIVKCSSSEIARTQYYKFNAKYNLVMQWPDLPSEIKTTEGYRDIMHLTDQILFFFIDRRKDNYKWINELKTRVNEK